MNVQSGSGSTIAGVVRAHADTFFGLAENNQGPAKSKVAKYIAENYLRFGDSIILDAGTSLYPIAEEIASQTRVAPRKTHYTIMTHNYRAFEILVEKVQHEANVNIVLAGGRYDRDLNALFGPQTIKAYDDFHPRVVLIGISGMVADRGLFCHGNTEELAVKEVIFRKHTRLRIVVADCTKIGLPDSLCFGFADLLHANTEQCIVVTNGPDTRRKDDELKRFQAEVATLKQLYNIDVIDVDHHPQNIGGVSEGEHVLRSNAESASD
jgi:DeoR/GlpR family transcriptional regulator of sugar metabolism